MSPRTPNRRIRLLLLSFVLLFALALGRAAWLQVVKGASYEQLAVRQHRETIPIPAGRGTIFDRTGEPLAIGEQTTTVFADPKTVTDPRRAALAVGKTLGLEPNFVYPNLANRMLGFVYVARKADPIAAAKLERLNIPGLGFYAEEKRVYPQAGVAAQVVGYAGTDNHGLEGLERSLDGTLAGTSGSETIVKDPFGRVVDIVKSRPERRGENITLTIDHQLPANAESVLEATVKKWHARGGPAIVLDPRTGQNLAMANAPGLDSNDFGPVNPQLRQKPPLTDVHQPGSAVQPAPNPGGPPTPRRHRRLRTGLDVQAGDDLRCAPGRRRDAADVVHAAADDQGRRPHDPRRRDARHRAHERPADPGPLLERRHRHDRRTAWTDRALALGTALGLRRADGRQLSG